MAIDWTSAKKQAEEKDEELKKSGFQNRTTQLYTPGVLFEQTAEKKSSSTPAANKTAAGASASKQQESNLLNDIKWGLGYGSERIAGGLLGAAESVSDFIGSTGSKALEYITSFGFSRPNDVSEFFRQQSENYLNTSPTEQYRQSIEQRYQPTDAQRTLGSLNETVAAMLPSLGAAALTGGGSAAAQLGSSGAKLLPTGSSLGRAIMGVQAAGGGAQEAFQEGATVGEALTFGAASGALETATEALVGGIPGLGKGAASELLEKVVSNPAVRRAIDIAGEGGEEAISTIVTPYLKRAIYDTSAENASLDEIAQNAIMGMAAAGVLQAGIELPSAISNRVDTTRQANANLNDPEFVRRTTNEAIDRINQNLNRQPFTLPSVEAQAGAIPQADTTAQVQQETAAQRRQGVQMPIEERTWQDAGSRKVNAFQYDHPELRPYYAEAARALKYDLSSAVKGERMPVYDAASGTRDIIGYTGTKRSVTEPIAQALDNANLSYAQIEKAIDDLIADNGQENYAAAKKLELVLDDMLTNGYTDSDGYDVPPNQAYLDARERANTGGTEYSMSEAEWASLMAQEPTDSGMLLPMVNGPESSVGAARKGFDPWSAFQGTKSEFFPEGANAARPVDVPTTDAEGNPIRKTASTVMGAKAIPDEVVGDIQNMVMSGDLSYTRMTDQDSVNRAVRTIEADGFQRSVEKFSDAVKKGVVSKDLATLGQQLLINAANARDANATAELLTLYAQMETTAGQAVQAASILRKLSPTAQLYAAQKAASNLEQTLSKKLKGQNITIDPDLIDEFNQQTDQAGRDVVLEKIYKNIADQVPSNWKDKWNAWRYLAMLGNPRTHARNFLGNVFFQPIRYTKDRIAALIESGVNAASGGKLQRTKSFVYNPELYAAAWQDYDNVADVLGGNKYDDVQSIINDNRTIFNKGLPTKALELLTGKTFDSGIMEGLRKGNSNLLGAEDMVFKRFTYAGALAGYLNVNGVTADQLKSGAVDPALLSAARDYAGQEALKATFNDKNQFSDAVSSLGSYRGNNIFKKAGSEFVSAVLPFKRTPANILVRGFEYSPLGLAKGLTYDLYQVKQGNMTGAQVIDNIAAGMTGSALMALGGLLAAAGVVTGGAGDDEKQADFNELTGGQTYALNLPGGGSVTLDWLAPEALPFFMGVQAMQSFGEEGLTADTITGAFASISEPMLEMSMLQSLNDLIDSVSYSEMKIPGLIGSALVSYLTQAIPTLGGQIERSSEETRMSTYTDKNLPLPTDVQYALGKASARIPGWDHQQIPYIDAWGRTESNGPLPLRVFNNFINPAYTSQENVTPLDEEIQRLYDATGDSAAIPDRAPKYLTVGGERVDLTADQYIQYATDRGQMAFELGTDMIETRTFSRLTAEQKVDALDKVYTYADAMAKADVSAYEPEKWMLKVESSGVDPVTAILYRMSEADTDTKRQMIMDDNSLTAAEKAALEEIVTGKEAIRDYSSDEAFALSGLSDSGQEKWARAEAWGMPYEDYVKYYPICAKSGKGMTKDVVIQNLIDAGMSRNDAYGFWNLIRNG